MKTLFTIAVCLICFLLIAKTKVTFFPFSVSFRDWRLAVGWFILIFGILIISRQEYVKGRRDGSDMTLKLLKAAVKSQKEKTNE